MDIFSGIAAFKQIYDIGKTILDAKDDLERKLFLGNLYAEIAKTQEMYASAVGLYLAEKQITMELTQRIHQIDRFTEDSTNYKLFQTEARSLVYRFEPPEKTDISPHYLCANCFAKQVISILQPCGTDGVWYQSYCPDCQNKYRMSMRPESERKSRRDNPRYDLFGD